jgi:hypothetical protein
MNTQIPIITYDTMQTHIDSIAKKILTGEFFFPENFTAGKQKVFIKQLEDIREKSIATSYQLRMLKETIEGIKKIFNIEPVVNGIKLEAPDPSSGHKNTIEHTMQCKCSWPIPYGKKEIRSAMDSCLDQSYRSVCYTIRLISWFYNKDIDGISDFNKKIINRENLDKDILVRYYNGAYEQWINELQSNRSFSCHKSTMPTTELSLEVDGSNPTSPSQKYIAQFGKDKNNLFDVEQYCNQLNLNTFSFVFSIIEMLDDNINIVNHWK